MMKQVLLYFSCLYSSPNTPKVKNLFPCNSLGVMSVRWSDLSQNVQKCMRAIEDALLRVKDDMNSQQVANIIYG